WVDAPADFIQVKIFGRSAEILETLWANGQIGKGMPVIAIGRFDPRPSAWIGKDGKAHAQVSFNAETLTTNLVLLALRQNRQTPATIPGQPTPPEDDWMSDITMDDMPF
ncbi:single-stranded DNA-binding protein, partial [Alloscardovia venturai]